jgi:hypothetical protein
VGTKTSLADALLYLKFAETCKTQGVFGVPSEPMGDGARVAACLTQYAPKVALIVKTHGNNPALKAYLEKRAKAATVPLF